MDQVYRTFLENTWEDALDMNSRSDVVRLEPELHSPPARYRCAFAVPYLRKLPSGTVEIASGPVMTFVNFPPDYLYSTDPHLYMRIAAMLTPDFLHPNVGSYGAICLGAAFTGGTPLNALVWELYEIVSYRNRNVDERNALTPEACRLIRAHELLLDNLAAPPLFRKASRLKVQVRPAEGVRHGA